MNQAYMISRILFQIYRGIFLEFKQKNETSTHVDYIKTLHINTLYIFY